MHAFVQNFDLHKTFKVTMILFLIIGAIPFIVKTKKQEGKIEANKATLIITILGLFFLFFGKKFLAFYEIEMSAFKAVVGLVLFGPHCKDEKLDVPFVQKAKLSPRLANHTS